MRIVKKMGWDVDASLQSYTIKTIGMIAIQQIRDIKRFLLVAGGIRDNASMER